LNVTVTASVNGINGSIQINEVNQCPSCKHAIKPLLLSSISFKDETGLFFFSCLYLCKACYNSFICQYKLDSKAGTKPTFSTIATLDFIAPIRCNTEKFDTFISDSFPNFVSIYNQALAAESYSLSEISGIGFRKALEFLIKDFLILKNPDKKESIEKTVLGNCINNFVDNPQLKIAASRAVWLGNDQTHYIQKFTDNDVNDLKRLIRLTVHWISMILETEEAEKIEQIK